jgi:hypothetical protein
MLTRGDGLRYAHRKDETTMKKHSKPKLRFVVPRWIFDDGLSSEIDHRIGGILFSHRATAEKLDEVSRTPWLDEKLSRRANKDRYKELGGMVFVYQRFLVEMTFSALANAIESLEIEIRRLTRKRFDIWNPGTLKLRYLKTARMVLCLNNIIKHNQGIIRRESSDHVRFVIDECGLPDGFELYLNPFLNFEKIIREVHTYMFDRASSAEDTPRVPAREIARLYALLIPDVISLKERPVPPSKPRIRRRSERR